MKHMFILTED